MMLRNDHSFDSLIPSVPSMIIIMMIMMMMIMMMVVVMIMLMMKIRMMGDNVDADYDEA
jgi:hypothetical protein